MSNTFPRWSENRGQDDSSSWDSGWTATGYSSDVSGQPPSQQWERHTPRNVQSSHEMSSSLGGESYAMSLSGSQETAGPNADNEQRRELVRNWMTLIGEHLRRRDGSNDERMVPNITQSRSIQIPQPPSSPIRHESEDGFLFQNRDSLMPSVQQTSNTYGVTGFIDPYEPTDHISEDDEFEKKVSRYIDRPDLHTGEDSVQRRESQLTNENWIKLGFGLLCLKDGLQEFIMSEMRDFQEDIQHEAKSDPLSPATRCSQCTTANLIKCPYVGICTGTPCRYHDKRDPMKITRECPNKVCQVFKSRIYSACTFGYLPNITKTDARRWSSDALELSKCYIESKMYVHEHSVAEINVVHLLSVIINHKRFKDCFTDDPQQDTGKLRIAKAIGQCFLLSPEKEITDRHLNSAIDQFIDVLSDQKFLANYQPAMTAIDQLRLLKSPEFVMRGKEEARVFQEFLKYCRKSMQQDDADIPFWLKAVDAIKNRPHTTEAKLTVEWNEVFMQDTRITHKIDVLLKGNKDLNPSLLNLACKIFGRKSPKLQAMCDAICSKIKASSTDIMHVWPGYRPVSGDNEMGLIFVAVTVRGRRQTKNVHGFEVVFCNGTNCNGEGKSVMASPRRKNKQFTSAEITQLQACLHKHSTKIMSSHSNVNIVSACSVKSKKYRESNPDNLEISDETCIVLYVPVKGIIPLQEEPFPKEIWDFPVDVREGDLLLYAGPNEVHTSVKMGCAISSDHVDRQGLVNVGTIGAFIKRDNKIFCTTSAHVLLNGEWMRDAIHKNGIPVTPFVRAHQPLKHNPIGKVHQAMCFKGDSSTAGMDIAIVELEQGRSPVSGDFPDQNNVSTLSDFNSGQPMVFNSGEIMEGSDLMNSRQSTTQPKVVKYGSKTLITLGKLGVSGQHVRTRPYTSVEESFIIELTGQLEVENDANSFSLPGDSGSFVFGLYNNDISDMRPFGMLVGGTTYGTTIVTPLADILRKLGINSLMAFPGHNAVPPVQPDRLDDLRQDIDRDVNVKLTALDDKLTTGFADIRQSVGQLQTDTSNLQSKMTDLENRPVLRSNRS